MSLLQTLKGLDFLHTRCNIIHTDIKPENVLTVGSAAAARNMEKEVSLLLRSGRDLPSNMGRSIPLWWKLILHMLA